MLYEKAISKRLSRGQGLSRSAIAIIRKFPRIDLVLTLEGDPPPLRTMLTDATDTPHRMTEFPPILSFVLKRRRGTHERSVGLDWCADYSP